MTNEEKLERMIGLLADIDKKKEEKAALVKSYNETIEELEKDLREVAREDTKQTEMDLRSSSEQKGAVSPVPVDKPKKPTQGKKRKA